MSSPKPPKPPSLNRGDVVWVHVPPEEARGHEQRGNPEHRPYLVLSEGALWRAGLFLGCPLTRNDDPYGGTNTEAFHVVVDPGVVKSTPADDGVSEAGHVLVEHVRCLSLDRVCTPPSKRAYRLGRVVPHVLAEVDAVLVQMFRLRP